MRALLQCVSEAQVTIEDRVSGSIGHGLLVFLGVGENDTEAELEKLWTKIYKLRIFEDENGKTNKSIADINGELLVVSQFTLYADCKKGNRPSFTKAKGPEEANRLYESFIARAKQDIDVVEHGEFGAMMDVRLVNHGPFTIWLDTDTL